MLDYAHRFHGLNGLNYVYRQGRMVRGAQLSLKYGLNGRRKTYRVAVVVSRKVDKSAVVRNRIRRRVYEAVRLQAAAIDQPYDLVFTAFSAALAGMDSRQLGRLVGEQLKKAGVTRGRGTAPHAIVNPEEQ